MTNYVCREKYSSAAYRIELKRLVLYYSSAIDFLTDNGQPCASQSTLDEGYEMVSAFSYPNFISEVT